MNKQRRDDEATWNVWLGIKKAQDAQEREAGTPVEWTPEHRAHNAILVEERKRREAKAKRVARRRRKEIAEIRGIILMLSDRLEKLEEDE